MYLKSLEISGFKSFAKKSRLEFTRGITTIVGPNGSGKSNIADSLRWVMGEQSLKTLRGKKSEDVIFSGSNKRSRLGMAEVSLELDNSDKKIPLEYSELVITRRIYRDGASEYLINGSKTKLGDINLLLTKANFGHRTYSVIGQGMVDNFLIATPQERKDFFEEATGVKEYQIKKNQSLNKLEKTLENLNSINVKITEIEPHLKLLTRQVKRLNRRKEIENELAETKLRYYSSFWHEINSNYERKKKEIDSLSENQKVIYNEWKQTEIELSEITRDNQTNKQLDSLRNKEQDLLNQKMDLREQIFKLKANFENQLGAPVKNSTPPIPQMKLEQIKHDLEVLLKNKSTLNDFIKVINEIVVELKKYTQSENNEKHGENNKKSNKIENNIAQTENKLTDLEDHIESVKNKIRSLTESDQQARSNLWKIQQKFQNKQNELNEINNHINETRISMARIETKRFDLKNEIEYELTSLDKIDNNKITPLNEREKQSLHDKIKNLKHQLEIIGGIDPEIEAEFKNTNARYEFLSSQTKDLLETIEKLKKLINELDETIKKKMKKTFDEINSYFKKYFKVLFNGGNAELKLIPTNKKLDDKEGSDENIEDKKNNKIFNFFQEKKHDSVFAGIEIEVTPPGKKLKSISVLSGGERALTSIALISAIISSNPSPFVILDEVDAALDEANSIRFADILREMSLKTQFIVVTHNRATMEAADLLYGVTMETDGISKLLSIKLEEAEKYES